MLERLTVRGFKSLREVTIEFGKQLTVLFGANAAGKSNLLEAINFLASMPEAKTVYDALDGPLPIRGYPFEAFTFPPGGLPALLQPNGPDRTFSLEADIATDPRAFRYRLATRLALPSGYLVVDDEYLCQTRPRGARATIENRNGSLLIRSTRRSLPSRCEELGLSHSIVSSRSVSGPGYDRLDTLRSELGTWRPYALEPRTLMRASSGPADVLDIGVNGQTLAPFMYKLRGSYPEHYHALVLKLRGLVPSVEDLTMDIDTTRGTLEIIVRQGGVEYSTHLLSDGMLRALAFCAISVNPWHPCGLVAIEEPENGVHPRRVEDLAHLFLSLAGRGERQVIVATHSPLFVATVLQEKRNADDPDDIVLLNVRHTNGEIGANTTVEVFEIPDALLNDPELVRALSDRGDEGLFEGMLLRGYINE